MFHEKGPLDHPRGPCKTGHTSILAMAMIKALAVGRERQEAVGRMQEAVKGWANLKSQIFNFQSSMPFPSSLTSSFH
jgi:hypothetical protein